MVDIGISNKRLQAKLQISNIDPNRIDVIFITHEHIDHVKGLKVFLNKYSPKVYMTRKTYQMLKIEIKKIEFVTIGDVIICDDNQYYILPTSHDAVESYGLMIKNNKQKIIHITDTGYINQNTLDLISDADIYLIESNFEPQMLVENEKYPFKTKQRIISDTGHLSNLQCHDYLKTLVTKKTKIILYAHLSENNNLKSHVLNYTKKIDVAKQIILDKDESVEVKIEN